MRVRRLVVMLLVLLVWPPPEGHAEQGDPRWPRCYEAIPWHHSVGAPDTETSLLDLVGRGVLAEHSRAWIRTAIERAPSLASCMAKAKDEKRLLLWYVPAVEGQHMVLPHLLDRYMMVGPWSHPDVVALVRRRFVAIRLPGGGELAQAFRLEMPRFMEPGLLVFAPDGSEILRMDRINTFAPDYFLHVLTTLVEQQAESLGHTTSYARALSRTEEGAHDEEAWSDLAYEAMLEGEYATARDALKNMRSSGNASARVAYLEAMLARRERRGEDGLRVLDSVRGAAPDLAADIRVERGRIHLRRGEYRRAVAALSPVAKGRRGSRRAEAAYHLGLAHYQMRGGDEARTAWRRAAELDPESLWAAKADACAVEGTDGRQGESALTRGMQGVRWGAEETYRAAADTQWRRSPEDVADIRRRAVSFLLEQQRSDGSWPGFRWGTPADGEGHALNIDLAIAALCCAALAEWQTEDPRRIAACLARGERYLLDDGRTTRGDEIAWVYADAYRVSYFAGRLPDLKTRRKPSVRRAMRGWIANLVEHQAENSGSFRHTVYRSTFVTAAVSTCLRRAADAGLPVPGEVFERAARVLAGARGSNGLFGYLLDNPSVTRTELGAAARHPLCVLALVSCGTARPAELPGAVDVYLESYERSTALARKANFHIPALDHTAGYYFFHDFHAACEATRAAGADARAQRQALLEKLCALPEIDGTFVDCGFSYGKSYSTAMALLSMHALLDDTADD